MEVVSEDGIHQAFHLTGVVGVIFNAGDQCPDSVEGEVVDHDCYGAQDGWEVEKMKWFPGVWLYINVCHGRLRVR